MENFHFSTDTLISAVWIALICSAALIPFVLVMKLLVGRCTSRCPLCGTSVIPFPHLTPDEQQVIREYFQRHENREPEIHAINVCPQCHLVFDDFCGDVQKHADGRTEIITMCKICGELMNSDPREHVKCMHCGTEYVWREYQPTGFRFLMPPPGSGLDINSGEIPPFPPLCDLFAILAYTPWRSKKRNRVFGKKVGKSVWRG